MTIVCYRAGRMACDAQLSSSRTKVGHVRKMQRTKNGWLTGFAGAYARCHQTLEANFKKMNINQNPNQDSKGDGDLIEGVAVAPDGAIWALDSGGWYPVMAEFFAIGCGSDIALGALEMGATPEEAVRVVQKYDVYCSGPISVLEL